MQYATPFQEKGRVVTLIEDGNFGLVLKESSGTSVRDSLYDLYFEEETNVDSFLDAYSEGEKNEITVSFTYTECH